MAEGSKIESPEYAKMSHASAISLGLMRGRMYRGAVNRCVNLLVHYPEGCSANCAYCGLAKKRPGQYLEKSFIHVEWPVYSMDAIIKAINGAPAYVKRTCISMITNGKCASHVIEMAGRLNKETSIPISILLSPTILKEDDLVLMRQAGVDKVGVALDLATPELFDRYRGQGVSGPHEWDNYWEILLNSLKIFDTPNVGVHLMIGMGETEEDAVILMDDLWQRGIVTHLFSFFAEKDSTLAARPQPPWPTYLRIQLARYLIEENLSNCEKMEFNDEGHIIDFGVSKARLEEVINQGRPFMTGGCLGPDGEVACNRPFGNCLPDVNLWNYPYEPNREEIELVTKNIFKIV